MMQRQKLSLLIPAFNAAWCLPRLLKSAHAQTVPFDEIWVYDDCSTDDTATIAQAYGAKVLKGDVNRGCSAGKNALARHVNAEWMHFHDADDELFPDFVERAQAWIQRDKYDVILFSYQYRDNDTKELLAEVHFDRTALEEDARRYAIIKQINPFCGLYRRSTFLQAGGYDEDPHVLFNEDVAFHIQLAFNGLSFSADEAVTITNYRVGGSMSAANQSKCAVAHLNVLLKTLDREGSAHYHPEIATKLWQASGVLASLDEWQAAKVSSRAAAALMPAPTSSGRAWFRLLARISPYAAVSLRERAIRLFRRHLRNSR